MKVILIFTGIFLLVAWVLSSFLKGIAKQASPLDSLEWNGTLGMRLGDGYKMIMSRLKHLDIKYKDTELFIDGEHSITAAEKLYNNIESIDITIHGGVCTCISLKLYPQQADMEFLRGKVERLITSKLGVTPDHSQGELFWINKVDGLGVMLNSDDSITFFSLCHKL